MPAELLSGPNNTHRVQSLLCSPSLNWVEIISLKTPGIFRPEPSCLNGSWLVACPSLGNGACRRQGGKGTVMPWCFEAVLSCLGATESLQAIYSTNNIDLKNLYIREEFNVAKSHLCLKVGMEDLRRASLWSCLAAGRLSWASITQQNAIIVLLCAPQTCQAWPVPTVSKSHPHYPLSTLVWPRRRALSAQLSTRRPLAPGPLCHRHIGLGMFLGKHMVAGSLDVVEVFFRLCLGARELCAFLSMLNSIKIKK